MTTEEIIVAASVAFGAWLLGIAASSYASRRRPKVTIVKIVPSTGPRPVVMQVEPDQILREARQQVVWARNDAGGYLDMEDLREIEADVEYYRIFLQAGERDSNLIDSLKSALDHNPKKNTRVVADLAGSQLLGNMMAGMARREELPLLDPTAIESAGAELPVTDDLYGVQQGVQGAVVLDLPTSKIRLPYSDEHDHMLMLRLIGSLATCSSSAISSILTSLEAELNRDMKHARQIVDEGGKLVERKSRWEILTQISNLGASPFAIHPVGQMEFKSTEGFRLPWGRSTPTFQAVRVIAFHEELAEESDELATIARNFQVPLPPPEAAIYEHVFLAPRSSLRMRFVAEEPLDTHHRWEDVRVLYDQGLLQVRLSLSLIPRGLSLSGTVATPWTRFARNPISGSQRAK